MRNKMEKTTRKFREMNAALSYRDATHGYFREKWSPLRNAPKLLARIADATPRTVMNWLTGDNAPNGDTLITLMARDPEFKNLILKLVEDRSCGGHSLPNLDGVDLALPGD